MPGRNDDRLCGSRTISKPRHFGSMYAKERVELLDREGLRASILYPSIGLTWEC